MEDPYSENDNIIREIGNQLIEQYRKNGVAPGLNGPYNDQETIIRNLSHLVVITAVEIILYSRNELIEILVDMGDTLINMRQKDGSYVLRNGKNKDQCNGVIGHAWVIEAFIYLHKILNDDKYINIALQIYSLHEFDSKLGLWRRPKKESSENTVDYTLNHQLWFAGVSALFLDYSKNEIIRDDLKYFFMNLNKIITIDSDGLICHSVLIKETKMKILKSYVRRCVDLLRRTFNRPSYFYKEVGYHIFNVAALARLFLVFPNDVFWKSDKFKKIIQMTNSELLYENMQIADVRLDISLCNSIENDSEKKLNVYAFPYNVPGFEMYYIKEIFNNLIDDNIVNNYLFKQLELTYDESSRKFAKHCFDKVTINYRTYEYYLALEARG